MHISAGDSEVIMQNTFYYQCTILITARLFISDGTRRKAVWKIALVTWVCLLAYNIRGEHCDISPPLQDPLIDEDVTWKNNGFEKNKP